ncbi:MAG: hypothetical protein J3Q66DRAFT_353523 [Benniella sp.]|nr:MAG: hypothetical protein J3Q66DRAFT_353523 [Benniella sp.]
MENIYPYLECIGEVCKYILIGGCVGSIAIPFIVAAIPFLLGFGVGGIVSGSIASMLMARHNGYVPINGFVSNMQRMGEKGWQAGFNPGTIILGCILGLCFGGFLALSVHDVCSV